jgi:hypothetical protein
MEAAIENIASLVAVGNLVVNQLMEREATVVITAKAASAEKPKWTMVMAKNVRQVVSRVVETLVDAPKQEERKLNLRLMGFKTKEGETEKELVQRLNTKLLHDQMKLHTKVVAASRQRPATTQASTLAAGMCLNVVLLKFATNEDRQAVLRGCKGLARTKLGLEEDFTPTQQVRKSELWPLFKEAKATSKCTF